MAQLVTSQHIYICRIVISLSTFWSFRRLFVCPPFCPNLILTAARSKWKLLVCHRRVISLSTFGVHFWPQKVYKLITFEAAKLITFKWLYGFPYLGLFVPFFEKKNLSLNWKANGHIGGQTNNFLKFSMLFFWHNMFFGCCFLIFLFFCFFCFLFLFLVPFWCFCQSSSISLSYVCIV